MPLKRLVKVHSKRAVETALEEFLRDRSREALEMLFEEFPMEHRERRHRPCRWLKVTGSIRT
jgi:hypothetical protein